MRNLDKNPPATLMSIPSGVLGVIRTLSMMRAVTHRGRKSVPIRQLAVELVADLPSKDYGAEIQRLHAWVRDRIRYVRDVREVETIQTPERTLANGAGDCDDKSVLLASLLEAIGHHARFTAIGFGRGYVHVLPEVLVGRHWVPLEVTEHVPPGWLPEGIVEKKSLEV